MTVRGVISMAYTEISKQTVWRMCVYAPYQSLFFISHNQGVSRTHKHEIDSNWVGVNFSLEGFEVRIKGQSQTRRIQRLEYVRADGFLEDDSNYHSGRPERFYHIYNTHLSTSSLTHTHKETLQETMALKSC